MLFVLLVAPIAIPMVAVFAGLLMREGGRPFYCQTRIGQDGRRFKMIKLRSMVPDADGRLDAYLAANPEARREWQDKQKLANDPRVTRLGRFLRKSSMDELPQLWNVFRGDMSIVGPRPMLESQQGMYPGAAYYALRPGITGLWQVADRNQSSFAARADYDTQYQRRMSLWTDVAILARTVTVVMRGTGC